MLAVAGLAFAYTSCTDYSKDIDENSKEIESLSGRLATAEQQITSLKADVTSLQTAKTEAEKAIAALQTSLSTLQTKHDADVKKLAEDYAKADEALKAEIQKKIDEANAAHEKDVEAVKTLITALQTKVTDLETEVGKINETIKTLATKEYVDATFATKDALASAEEKIGALRTDLTAAEGKVTALEGKYDDALVKIAAAQKAADVADSLARKSLGDVEVIKDVLGTFTEKGSLDAKIDLLDEADSTLKAELATKFNSSDFQKTFDEALKNAIEADGIVGVEIAKQITAAKTELEGKIKNLKDEVNAKFSKLYADFMKQLKSLVFVPDLYVDGIEATEYTYAKYKVMVLQSPTKDTEYTEYGDGQTTIKAIVPKAEWLFKDYTRYTANPYKDRIINRFMDPASVVTYKMNPSTADVTAETPLALITDDKEYIKTRNSVNEGTFVRFVSAKDGELKVEFDAKSFEQNYERKSDDVKKEQEAIEKNMVSIFALQATVKDGEGQDTTITSDFARLYISDLSFENLAFTKADYTSTLGCELNTQDHIYPTLKEAIENAPSVNLLYNGAPLDLDDVVTTHYNVTRYENGEYVEYGHKDYDADRAAGTIDDFKVKYEFLPIDYLLGDNKTSETQHLLFVDNSKVVACNVTDGKQDPSLTGDKARQSVGRRPIVMVKMTVNGELVKIGFIKFEIREQLEYKVADEFDWAFRFYCGGDEHQSTWGQMVDKILKVTGDTRETFSKNFALKVDANKAAVQYFKVGEDFVPEYDLTADQMKALGIKVRHFGTVTEILDNDAIQPGTTTSTLKWNIGLEDMSRIYSRNGNKVTVWVLYESTTVTNTTKYDGIYVPLTAVVNKPSSDVSEKLSNYWFNDLKSAKINVAVPSKDLSKYEDKIDPTRPWFTNINQVWDGNAPKFDFGEEYPQVINVDGTNVDQYTYKYYFAPVQTYSDVIDNVYYEFFVDNTAIVDRYLLNAKGEALSTTVADNEKIGAIELAGSADVEKGIYTNSVLKCRYISTTDKDNAGNNWKSKAATAVIATLDGQNTSKVTYDEGPVAKLLLNAYASEPTQYTEAKLHVRIGVTAYMRDCKVAVSLNKAVNPYYFLRPVNAVAAADKYFVDSEDQQAKESNIDLFKLFTFKDWRGKAFFEEPVGDAAPDYSNLWYFKYYHVSKVEVDLANVTTTLNGGTLGKTYLNDKTEEINLYHLGIAADGEISITTEVSDPWGESQYKGLVGKFGYIHYHNNGTPIDTKFTLRIPVKFTYTWGTINTHVDVEVLPLGSK